MRGRGTAARTAAKVAVAAGVVVGSVFALTATANAAVVTETVQTPFGQLHSFAGLDDVWVPLNGAMCRSYVGEAQAVPVIEGNAGTSASVQLFVNGVQQPAAVHIIEGQDLGLGIGGYPIIGGAGSTFARASALVCVGAGENLGGIELTVNNTAFASVAGLTGTVDASVTDLAG